MTVYKVIQVVGTSNTSFSDAVRGAVERASQTLEDIRWFEVKEMRGRIADGEVSEYQVKIDLAFHLHGAGKETGDKGTASRRKSAGRATEATPEARSQAAQATTARRRR